jgi:hypothetical protein
MTEEMMARKVMDYSHLRVGDEVIIRHSANTSCRAKITGRKGEFLTAVLWNSISQRWNTAMVLVGPERVLRYPKSSAP